MPLQLCQLPRGFRFGLACLVLVLLYGMATGLWHMLQHHENRDARPGFGLDDVRGAYHGIRTRAPLLVALDRGHPDGVPAAEQQALRDWLHGEAIDQGYDDERKGALAPAEILARRCVDCHARQATHGGDIGKRVPLEYLSDVRELAISRDVEPTAAAIVIASAHTHALAMGTLTVVALLLALATRWSRRLLSPLAAASWLGLLLDLLAWLPARHWSGMVEVLVIGGGSWFVASAALLLLVLVDLLRPAGPATASVHA